MIAVYLAGTLLGACAVAVALLAGAMHIAKDRDDWRARCKRLTSENEGLQARVNDLSSRLTRKPQPYRELANTERVQASEKPPRGRAGGRSNSSQHGFDAANQAAQLAVTTATNAAVM